MSIVKTVLKNVVSSWAGFAFQVLVTLALTPIVIQKLGLEAYGVWLFLQSVVGYYGLIDIGLRAGLTQSITHRIAEGNIARLRRHLSVAIPTLLVVGVAVLTIAILVCVVLPRIMNFSEDVSSSLWWIILLQAFSVVLQLVLAPYNAVSVGAGRFDLINGVGIFSRLFSAILVFAVLTSGYGLLGLSAVTLVSSIFESYLRYKVATMLIPEIKGIRFAFDLNELREIGSFGIWNLVIESSRQLIYFSDVLVVGLVFSASAVAPFGFVSTLVEYGTRLIIISTSVLFPTMTKLRESNDLHGLRELYFNANRITLATALTLLIAGSFWLSPFLALWLGNGAAQQNIRAQAPSLYFWLSLAFTFVALQRTGIQLLLAQKKLRYLAILFGVEAVANLLLSLLLSRYFGLTGIALGTAIPAFVMCFVFHLPKHAAILNVSYFYLLQQTLIRPVLYAMSLLILLNCLTVVFGKALSPTLFGLAVFMSALVIACSSCLLFSRAQLSCFANWLQITAKHRCFRAY